MKPIIYVFLLTISLGSSLFWALQAQATPEASVATFTVNSTEDAVDVNPGDGVCATSTGVCTLRAAIQEANALPGQDSIALAADTYLLTLTEVVTDTSAYGDLRITEDLIINGVFSSTTVIDAQQISRVFHISTGVAVTMSNLTVQNGLAGFGGGIFNFGRLTLNDVTVTDNQTSAGIAAGAGIYTQGILTGTNLLIKNNTTPEVGGGLWNHGQLTLIDSHISDNQAKAGGGIQMTGGTLALHQVAIVNNTSTSSGGGLSISHGDLTMLGGTVGGNVAATFGGGGFLGNNNSSSIIANTIFADNAGQWGGGLMIGGDNAQIEVSNAVFENNTATAGGGAIYYGHAANSTLTITDSTFNGNFLPTSASSGGGALLLAGADMTLMVIGSQFTQNVSPFRAGGAIYNLAENSELQITQSTFTGNTGYSGGAFANGGTLATTTISNSQFDGNVTNGGSGGAIYYGNPANATLLIENSRFADHSAQFGGALLSQASPTTINKSAFVNNSSLSNGGALHLSFSYSLTNVTISGNQAHGSGGGIYGSWGSSGVLNNVTLAFNTADANSSGAGDGGGFALDEEASLQVQNSIIAQNEDLGSEAPDCFSATAPASGGTNIVGQSNGCNWSAAAGDLVGTAVSPIDPLLGSLVGSLSAHIPQPGSPAIDAGSALTPGAGSPACAAEDQLGTSRPQDGDEDGTAVCDIGAIEYLPAAAEQLLFLPLVIR